MVIFQSKIDLEIVNSYVFFKSFYKLFKNMVKKKKRNKYIANRLFNSIYVNVILSLLAYEEYRDTITKNET